MTLDDEGKELIAKLQDIENRLISDAVVEESIYNSIKSLEVIFGKESRYSEILDKFKSVYKVNNLDEAIQKSIKSTKSSIEVANASALAFEFNINKNSILSDFLVESGRLSDAKLKSFHEFFRKTSPYLEIALEKGDTIEVKKVLREYIEILESEEKYLKDNIYQITKDITNTWSLHNLMSHEFAHMLFGELSKYKNTYSWSLNEAFSFSLQKLGHTFDENYIFTKDNLLKEIKAIYKFIIPRQHGYSEIQYLFMKPFIIFISILILSDSIARKEGNYKNKELFIKSYSYPTFNGIFALINESIGNLKNIEFKESMKDTLMKTGLSQLSDCKSVLIKDLDDGINKLPAFVKQKVLTLKGPITKDWDSFKESLVGPGSILYNNTRHFVASLELLKIINCEDIAQKYRDEYMQILETTLNEIAKYTNDAESRIYQQEKHAIDGVCNIIEQEEQDLKEILQEMKS